MKYDLKTPCKNCPFADTPDRITFACRERAEEIEEQAYRQGFPCHLSAVLVEDGESGGYEAGPDTQHCAGVILMYMHEGLIEGAWERMDLTAPAFKSVEDFLDASPPPPAVQ